MLGGVLFEVLVTGREHCSKIDSGVLGDMQVTFCKIGDRVLGGMQFGGAGAGAVLGCCFSFVRLLRLMAEC